MFRAKQCCADCHFFGKEARSLNTPQPVTLAVSPEERALAKKNDFTWVKDYATLLCHFGVWDEGFNFDKAKRFEILVETDRRGFCFFWHFRPGMLNPAAKILQEREAQNREASKERWLTIVGLWIAALALVFNIGLKIAEGLGWWP